MNIRNLSKNIYLFLLINVIYSFSMGIFNMFLGIYLKEIGYQESLVGTILSINTFAIAIASIPSAYLIEKIGRKKSFILGFTLITISNISIALFQNAYVIGFIAIFNGLGLSLKATAEGLYITENTNINQRVDVFSFNFVVSNVGLMTSSFLGGILSTSMNKYFGKVESISIIFLISAFLTICAMIPIYFMKEDKTKEPRSLKGCILGYKNIINKKVISFITCNFLIGIGAGMVVPFFSVYLKYSMSISDGLVGTILSISQLGCIVGGTIIPIISSKLGKHKSVVMCQILSIPFLISIAFPQGLVVIIISFFMRNGLMNMASPLLQNLAMELVDEENRTNMSSLSSLSSNISRAVGISIGGLLMENISYNAPYYITIVVYLVSIMLFTSIYKEYIFINNKNQATIFKRDGL